MARLGGIDTQYFDLSGAPLSWGLLYAFETGTDTPKPTYFNGAEQYPNPWPIQLDAIGVPPDVFYTGDAKLVLKDSAGTTIRTMDPVSLGPYEEGTEILYRLGTIASVFMDADGNPLRYGKLYIYINGTSTPKNTYTTNALNTMNEWPVVLDENGFLGDVFYEGKARIVLTDADDVQQRELDEVETFEIDRLIDLIATCPESLTVASGSDATFTITVFGDVSDYTIAWYKDDVLIVGETGLTMTLPSVVLADDGALITVAVTFGAVEETCAAATLTVDDTACALVFPASGSTITATQILLGSDDHYGASDEQHPGDKGQGGVFRVYGNKIMACPESDPVNGLAEMYFSDDYGATFTQVTDLPYPSYGITVYWHYPRVIEHDGTRWWVYAYGNRRRSAARYSSADDGTTWTSYPWPADPDNPTKNSYSYNQYGFTLDGGDNFVHLTKYLKNGVGLAASVTEWCGLVRRDLYTGVFGANLPINLGGNGYHVLKLSTGYFCLILETRSGSQDYYAYFVNSAITTVSAGTRIPSYDDYLGVVTNGDATVLLSDYLGGVYKWDVGVETFDEVTLTGRYTTSSGYPARTMVARKSDLWLAMSVKEGQSTARLFHSTDADGANWSSTYVTLNLPATIGDGAQYVELQAGEDGYWYGSMYSTSGAGNERLFKFEYEARVGDCP